MFGSYPHPRNFYAQNTTEFITIYVKDGKPANNIPDDIKEQSKLTQAEWVGRIYEANLEYSYTQIEAIVPLVSIQQSCQMRFLTDSSSFLVL